MIPAHENLTDAAESMKAATPQIGEEVTEPIDTYQFGWHDSDIAGASVRHGLSEIVVYDTSAKKNEPGWMSERHLKASEIFDHKPLPTRSADLSSIDFDNIKYSAHPTEKQAQTQEDLPEDVKNTCDKLGIPKVEKQYLAAGVAVQYESKVAYHQTYGDLESQDVISPDTDTVLKEHPELFKEHFGIVILSSDNKFSALNTVVWSDGSFIYVPKGAHVDIPLKACFRINTGDMGQFECTLIIVDEDTYVHYAEGCIAPIYESDSLHPVVAETIVREGGRCRYIMIQNWSNGVCNLVTKRTKYEEGATMEWIDGNIGSKVTMEYPVMWITNPYTKDEVLSVVTIDEGQSQDIGVKMVYMAPHMSSNVVFKSAVRDDDCTVYRDLMQVDKGTEHSHSNAECDALLVDTISRPNTYPYVNVREDDVTLGYEAAVSKVPDGQLFYLISRGIEEEDVMTMVVRDFVEPIARELPVEYALGLSHLIEL